MFAAILFCVLARATARGQEKGPTPSTPVAGTNSATRVAIIGAGGYIGSHVHAFLLSAGMEVTGYDRAVQRMHQRPTPSQPTVHTLASRDIPDGALHGFNAVIYLGGLTGRVACERASPSIVEAENVADLAALARRMRPNQLLIFASTSALLEGSGARAVNESWIVQTTLLDQYAGSMIARETAMRLLGSDAASPRLVGLRFGTVIGASSGQRVDLAPMALTRSAFTSGVLRVSHPETMRAFLCLEDLSRAMKTLVTQYTLPRTDVSKLRIYHLSSFNTNIAGLANAVAARTGARLEVKEHEPEADVTGFSLDSRAFARAFDYEFYGSMELVVKRLVDGMPESVTAKGVHAHQPVVGHGANASSIPCPVCGSYHLQEVLDLHEQPLANNFRSTAEAAMNVKRYPLRLMRCKRCNHMHLSKLVSRTRLFSDYIYVSGTSSTLLQYFDWLADKVSNETTGDAGASARSVLELACNDGSQLDKFARRGWKTYGVDPAANIVPAARAKGHTVRVGFWGAETPAAQVPAMPSQFDAIIAQNVLAHVPHPVDFLRACAAAMAPWARLYIQTSQCQMHQEGQFDTAYHEHLSFFTSHSFLAASTLAGLRILDFMTTPIHGESCLWTLDLDPAPPPKGEVSAHSAFSPLYGNGASANRLTHSSVTLAARLRQEAEDGLTSDFFYQRCLLIHLASPWARPDLVLSACLRRRFGARAEETCSWIEMHLFALRQAGYRIGAYGAAAKGMVLLHFLLARTKRLGKWVSSRLPLQTLLLPHPPLPEPDFLFPPPPPHPHSSPLLFAQLPSPPSSSTHNTHNHAYLALAEMVASALSWMMPRRSRVPTALGPGYLSSEPMMLPT